MPPRAERAAHRAAAVVEKRQTMDLVYLAGGMLLSVVILAYTWWPPSCCARFRAGMRAALCGAVACASCLCSDEVHSGLWFLSPSSGAPISVTLNPKQDLPSPKMTCGACAWHWQGFVRLRQHATQPRDPFRLLRTRS
jgi:hypothetical protein